MIWYNKEIKKYLQRNNNEYVYAAYLQNSEWLFLSYFSAMQLFPIFLFGILNNVIIPSQAYLS